MWKDIRMDVDIMWESKHDYEIIDERMNGIVDFLRINLKGFVNEDPKKAKFYKN